MKGQQKEENMPFYIDLVTMDRWTVPHRTTAVRFYYETKSVIEVQRQFRRHFNVDRHGEVPSRNTILAWVRKFEETGSVLNVNIIAIIDEVAAIDVELRRRVYGDFQKRLQKCIDSNGGHLSDIIFKK